MRLPSVVLRSEIEPQRTARISNTITEQYPSAGRDLFKEITTFQSGDWQLSFDSAKRVSFATLRLCRL